MRVLELNQRIAVVGRPSNLRPSLLTPVFICPGCESRCTVIWINYALEWAGCRKCCGVRYCTQLRRPKHLLVDCMMSLVQYAERHPDSKFITPPDVLRRFKQQIEVWQSGATNDQVPLLHGEGFEADIPMEDFGKEFHDSVLELP